MGKGKDIATQNGDKGEQFRISCLKTLRQVGCRITQQRRAVIDCLAEAQAPLSAPELFARLDSASTEAKIDRVSVYRILDTLLEHKLVHRIAPNGSFVACTHHKCRHAYHVLSRCTECQGVQEVDIPAEVIDPLLRHMASNKQFIPDTHLLHMEGVCGECAGQ